MSPSDIEVFTREILCDQQMAALAVKAGEDLSLQTIIQLGAGIEAIIYWPVSKAEASI